MALRRRCIAGLLILHCALTQIARAEVPHAPAFTLPPASAEVWGESESAELPPQVAPASPSATSERLLSAEVSLDDGASKNTTDRPTVDVGGWARSQIAARAGHSTRLTKLRQTLFVEQNSTVTPSLRFHSSQRFQYDAAYDLTDHFPEPVREDERTEIELREGYVDYSEGPFDLRLGKQQVVWGESVGLFFADTVNARDLREFVLPDFDLIRIPEWSADIEYTQSDQHVEFVWIPYPVFNRFGRVGSEYSPIQPQRLPPNTIFEREQEPANQLENSVLGTRVGRLIDGWDLNLFFLYTWDRSALPFHTYDGQNFYVYPQYRRLNQFGYTVSKTYGDIVARSEFVYSQGGYLLTNDPTDSDGLIKRDYADYVVGADVPLSDSIESNFQIIQRAVFRYQSTIQRNEALNTMISIRIAGKYLDGDLEPEFLWITSVDKLDMLMRPRVRYHLTDAWQIVSGADLFQGNEDGLFGQFNDRNRVYGQVEYYF